MSVGKLNHPEGVLTRRASPRGALRPDRFAQATPGRRFGRVLGSNAAPERVHEVDDVLAGGLDRGGMMRGTFRLLLAQNAHERVSIVILQHGRIEFRRFGPYDVLRELHHLGWKLHLRNVIKVIVRAAYLVREAQRYTAKAVAHWLQKKWTLARGQDDARKSDDVLAGHRIADHRKRFLPDLLSRDDVVWLFEISRVYLSRRQEALDLDRARVLRTGSRVLLVFVFFIVGIVSDLFLNLLVQTRGHHGRAFAAGRFH